MFRALSLLALLAGCAPTPAPVADAGALVVGSSGEVYLLDGSSSQGEGLRYSWALLDGPADVNLTDADAQTAYLQPTVEGVYTLSLTVCDRWDRCDEAETFALVGEAASRQRLASFGGLTLGFKPFGKNRAPEAEGSASRSLRLGGAVKLDGTASSDPDGDSLRYRWTFTSRPAGSALTDADIVDSTSALASFTGDVKGTYSVKLVVRDGMLADSVVLPDIVLGWLDDSDPLDDLTRRPGEPRAAETAQRSSAAPLLGGVALDVKPFAKNRAPEAEGSASRSLRLGGAIKLDGTASSDPDGDSLRYRWTFTSRPAGSALTDADIVDSTSALASFTGDVKGTYGVKLVVRDGMLTDSVVLPDIVLNAVDDNDPLEDLTRHPSEPRAAETAQRSSAAPPLGGVPLDVKPFGKNRAPEAEGSASRSMGLSGTIKLDGTASSDPDGDSLRYRWTFTSRPAGSALTDADIVDSTSALASFTGDVKGTYSVKLVVRDGMLADSVVLPDIVLGYVHDSDPLDDLNRRPGEPRAAETAQRSSAAPPLGGVALDVKPFGKNRAPEAEGSASRSLDLGGTIQLDGTASSDPDGDSLRYRWTFTSRPAGSALTDADIVDSTSALASFTGDVKGTYSVKLVVRDGMLADSVVLPEIVLGFVDDNDPLDLNRRPGEPRAAETAQP